MAALQAQFQPKLLRQEVLQSQAPVKPNPKATKKRVNSKILPQFKPLAPIISPLDIKGATLVYLENSETMTFDKNMNPDIQVLKGNVRFRHDNALMFCDSAYFYNKANSLDAFGNVRIVQGDTLFVYGDMLYYDGNIKLARLRRNVRMVNRKTTLTTDSLNYDRLTNLAYYYTGGKIVDTENTLTSIWGQYSTTNSNSLFKQSVHLVNKSFVLDADSLRYNTKTHIANIISPSHIVYDKETDIYSKRGWYNTNTERMMLLDRSKIVHKDGKILIGDTIFYDKKQKFGEGFTHVVMNDTVQKSTLFGNYSYYSEKTKLGMASDSALLMDWSTRDTMYVHADTLFKSKDSIYDVVRGYYHVRFYRNDIQGLCDSLTYSARDSILNMHGEPVVWSDENQLAGQFIQALTKNQKVYKINIQREAIAIQRQDSNCYNQLAGKEIIAHVDSGQLKKVNVNGNAETIYYPVDEKDSTIIGLNKTQSSYVVMYLKNKKADRIVMTSATTGIMYPAGQLSGGDLYLKNFFWLDKQRPKNKKDLFLIFAKMPREKIGTSSLMDKVASNNASSAKKTGTNSANKTTQNSQRKSVNRPTGNSVK
jgi:lipopolysaccharide export system protein LptA